ncbi:hypothetical protein pb186bvf_005800 [Paramecium bursaria]
MQILYGYWNAHFIFKTHINLDVQRIRIMDLIINNILRLNRGEQILEPSSSYFIKNYGTIENKQFVNEKNNLHQKSWTKISDDNQIKNTTKKQYNNSTQNQNTVKKQQDTDKKQLEISSQDKDKKDDLLKTNKKNAQKFKKVKGFGNPNHIKKILFQRQNYKREVNQIINQFYQQSFLQRNVQDELLKKHIRQVLGKSELVQEYNIKEIEGLDNVNQFVTIRGDGNCLFTSLMVQLLAYYSKMQNRHQLNQLIKQTPFNCYLNDLKISEQEQEKLKVVFQDYIYEQWYSKKPIQDLINNSNESFYGLMVIFLRNLFHQLLQDEDQELHYMINQPENIDKILEWEHMYDETEIALKMFAVKYQFNIKVFSKLNIDQENFEISEYRDDNGNETKAELGLAFQPGHYNALFLNELKINNQ